MVRVEGCWVANVNKLMFVLSGCCPGDIIRPRTIFIFLISSQSTDYRFHFIISLAQLLFADRLICCGLGQVCEMWFEKETVQIGNVLIDWAGEVWAGAGGAPRMGPNVSCGLEFTRQPAPAPAPYTALAPSADFWYRLTGRGGGGLLAAVPRAETTQPSPAAATRHTLKFRPSISIGLPICNAD